jgi:hypothetical protein
LATRLTRAALVVAGALAAYAFVACATGDSNEPAPTPTSDGAVVHDTGSHDAGAKDGGGDAAPACNDAAAPTTCTSPIDVGKIGLGKSSTVDATLAPNSNDAWFKITFDKLDDVSAHPHVVLGGATASALLLEVSKNCTGARLSCGEEDATPASTVTEFEAKYLPGAGDGGADVGDDSDPATIEAGVFAPIELGAGGVIYVRVFRKAGAPGPCAPFQLAVTN